MTNSHMTTLWSAGCVCYAFTKNWDGARLYYEWGIGESCGMCARGATESVGFFLMFDVRPCELSTVTVIFTFGL